MVSGKTITYYLDERRSIVEVQRSGTNIRTGQSCYPSRRRHKNNIMTTSSLLETRSLIKEYRNRRVVDQVNLQVETASLSACWGQMEPAKQPPFIPLSALSVLTADHIYLNRRGYHRLTYPQTGMAKGITYLAQEPSVFKKLTVEENVRIVLEPLGLTKNEINNRIR